MGGGQRTAPAGPIVRVHRAPDSLVRRVRPLHRFDDPQNEYGVWYFASTLRGALIEVLDHWRDNAATEADLASVTHVDGFDVLGEPGDGEEYAGSVPDAFLSSLRVASAVVEPADDAGCVDLVDEQLLADLNLHPLVADALRSGGVEAFGDPPTLGFGSVAAASVPARRLTQAVSRAVFEDPETAAGLRYISRHTENEECWALFAHESRTTAPRFTDVTILDPLDEVHLRTVVEVAGLLRLKLPPLWATADATS